MNKIIASLLIVGIGLAQFGCASFDNRVPSSAITKADRVAYFTQRDSIPKDVIYRPAAAMKASGVQAQVIDPAIIGAVLGAIPEITEGFLQVRNNVVLSDKEVLIKGYNLTSEDVKNITQALKSPIDSAGE